MRAKKESNKNDRVVKRMTNGKKRYTTVIIIVFELTDMDMKEEGRPEGCLMKIKLNRFGA